MDYNKHCKYEFGQYVQVHDQHDNTMLPRTTGALALRPTGNAQGNFYFFSLTTGRVLNRVHATPLPMPDDVIKRVETLARRQWANPGLVFGDREQQPINDLDDYYYDKANDADYNVDDEEQDDREFDEDYEYASEDDDEEYNEDIEGENGWQAIVDMIVPEPAIPEADEPNTGDPDSVPNDQHMNEEPEENHDAPMENPHLLEVTVESTGVEDDQDMTSDTNAVETPGVGNDPTEPDIGTESKTIGGYSLRQNRARTYSHLKTQASSQEWGETHATTGTTGEVNQSTAQVPMKTGLHLFGDAGNQAMKSEMGQLHKRTVMKTKYSKDLTTEQWREALAYLMFLKQKRCGRIKARGCADGRKQRDKITKQESASPTVATESVFITAVVDAHEGRTVKIVDVPGAFMHADQDDLVHV